MSNKLATILFLSFLFLPLFSCKDDDIPSDNGDLTSIDYAPVGVDLEIPPGYPLFEQPEDNKLSVEGVLLGRQLFYDPILSADETMSCASCHFQEGSFTDNKALSKGIDGIEGKRSSMSLINLAYSLNGLFWDGRVRTLEEQALLPIEDPLELHNNWEDLILKLKSHDEYPSQFRKAFGITNKDQITRELAVKAIAQFERTLISSGNSEFDKVFHRNEGFFSPEADRGFNIFFDKNPDLPDGECFHCHNEPLLTDNTYRNNGLDYAETLEDFEDNGFGDVTGIATDNGKFKVPSLVNWEFTAPYMHDGRFETIDEVLDHYISGGKYSPNKDVNIVRHDDPSDPRTFINDAHKADLLAFLKTFRDTSFINNEAFSNPFE